MQAAAQAAATPRTATPQQQQQQGVQQQGRAAAAGAQSADHGLTLLAVALSVVIAAMLLRKLIAAYGSMVLDSGDYSASFQ